MSIRATTQSLSFYKVELTREEIKKIVVDHVVKELGGMESYKLDLSVDPFVQATQYAGLVVSVKKAET